MAGLLLGHRLAFLFKGDPRLIRTLKISRGVSRGERKKMVDAVTALLSRRKSLLYESLLKKH